MPLSDVSYPQLAVFLLIFLRASSLIVTLPFFGANNVPVMVKAGLAFALALWLAPIVKLDPGRLPVGVLGMGLLCTGEMMIGAILGLAVRLTFTAVQIMGQLMGFQMGFAVANVLDPVSGGQVSVLAQFAFLMSMLTLFAVGGHHWFFKSLAESFYLVPPGDFTMTRGLFNQMMTLAAKMFSLAIRIGAPVIAALLFTQVIMGILAKTVPQMNILIVGFPVTITIGLLFLTLVISILVSVMGREFSGLGRILGGLLRAM